MKRENNLKAKTEIIILITIGIFFTLSLNITNDFNSNTENSESSAGYNADFYFSKNLRSSVVSGKIPIDKNGN